MRVINKISPYFGDKLRTPNGICGGSGKIRLKNFIILTSSHMSHRKLFGLNHKEFESPNSNTINPKKNGVRIIYTKNYHDRNIYYEFWTRQSLGNLRFILFIMSCLYDVPFVTHKFMGGWILYIFIGYSFDIINHDPYKYYSFF